MVKRGRCASGIASSDATELKPAENPVYHLDHGPVSHQRAVETEFEARSLTMEADIVEFKLAWASKRFGDVLVEHHPDRLTDEF